MENWWKKMKKIAWKIDKKKWVIHIDMENWRENEKNVEFPMINMGSWQIVKNIKDSHWIAWKMDK